MSHDIIDNSQVKLASELKKKLANAKSARFAVGWFFLTGLREIKEEIENLDKLQILVGAKTNRQTAEAMLLAKKYKEAVEDELEKDKYVQPSKLENVLDNEFTSLVERISFIKPTPKNVEFIKWFFEKLRQGKIEIHIYPKEPLHAKLYLLDYPEEDDRVPTAFVGSSNLSMSGLNLNTELNVAVYGHDNHKTLSKWFDEKWRDSEEADFTELAQKAIEKSWVMNKEVTPFRVYLRILHEMFSIEESEIPETDYGEVNLYDFQKDAVIDAYNRLMKYNGVFLADVPGLGKTYMGSALLAHLQEEGKKALVICPPKLKETWKDVLDELGVGTARIYSHHYSRLGEILRNEKLLEREIVLIDEAHHFRNRDTNRYQDMEIICENKKVILVGATPQNLGIEDLYHQIKLFTPSEIDHKFRIGQASLKAYFKACEDGKSDIENLIADIVIRRTRQNILDTYGKDRIPPFPERKGPFRVDYNIDEVYPGGVYEELNNLIDRLTFARYDIGTYVRPGTFEPDERQRIKQAGKNLRKIMRMIIFRRLESSIQAFKDSIGYMLEKQKAFLYVLNEGKVLGGESADDIAAQLRSETELEDLDIPDEAYEAEKFDTNKLEEAIEEDRVLLKKMLDMVEKITAEEDDKLQELVELLNSEKVKGKKTIIFTAFASTAKYLAEHLKQHFEKVDAVYGGQKPITKAKRFAPKANNYNLEPGEEIDILVSTEMLGEGMNLQDGQVIINYELHWNPVRIIQRIGRIDRIGSEHDEIYVYNFFPESQVEQEINVEKKVKERIDEIISRYGADTQTISKEERAVKKQLFEIYSENERALEEEEIESTSAYYRNQWKILKEDFPKEQEIALGLPAMVNIGRENDKEGVAVFGRSDDYYQLMFADSGGEILDKSDWEVLPLVECNKDTSGKEFGEENLAVIEKARKNFEKEVNKRELKKQQFMEKVKLQIEKKLKWAKRGRSERFKQETDEVIDLLREAKLSLSKKRELRKIRSKHALKPEELVEKVRNVIVGAPLRERKPPKKKYAQVIISENLQP